MKWMIASDIHGAAYDCYTLLQMFHKEKADRLLLLGDLLYHGARNDLPKDYDPKAVSRMLNEIKEHIICVRGNCDSEVDQMVLAFDIMADYTMICEEQRMIFVTHGHHFNKQHLPMLHKGDILLCGHTHVPALEVQDSYIYMNPGSVSMPKENSHKGYMIYENQKFIWKDLDGRIIMRYPQ